MIETYKKIRKYLINLFVKEMNFPSVTGREVKRKGNVTTPKIIYADEAFKLNSELKNLQYADLRSAEVNASNKGDIYLYSYIAPARYGVRAIYAGIINFISVLLLPLSIAIFFLKIILNFAMTVFDRLVGILGKIFPVAVGLLVILVIIGLIVGDR